MAHKIHEEIRFSAPVEKVYAALTVSDQFAAFTGKPANFSSEPGGEFSGFDNCITGRHIELVPNERIVQAWRVYDWPEGIYSIVRFELKPDAEGTQLLFNHVGFPEAAHDHLKPGWHKMYWDPLKKFLGT